MYQGFVMSRYLFFLIKVRVSRLRFHNTELILTSQLVCHQILYWTDRVFKGFWPAEVQRALVQLIKLELK